ncbi:MAG TPA: type II secretion system protein GspL [Geobacteraceae bacterium]
MNYLIVQLSAAEALFARFRKKGKDLVFVEASRDSIDAERPFTSMLAEFRGKSGEEERIVLAVPPARLFMREIGLQLTDRRKVREVLPLEMKGETAVDTDELVFDALPLEAGRFLAVWGKRTEIAEEIRGMTDQGMEPTIVTTTLFHWQALLPVREGAAPVGLTDGEALAVYHGGAPVFFRPLTGRDLAAEVGRTLAALEIGKGIRVEQVYLHGAAARNSAATPLTAEGIAFIPLPVTGELAATFPAGSAALDLAGAYALARACSGGEPIDLRRGELAYTAGRAKTRKKLRLSMLLAAALILLLFAEVGIRYFLVARDLKSLDTSIRSIYRGVFPGRKKAVDEVAELRSEIKRLSGAEAEYPVLPVLKKLAELKGEDVAGLYETEIEGDQLRVKGDARSVQAANSFRARAAGAFANAELGEVKSLPDGSVSFSLRASLKGSGK